MLYKYNISCDFKVLSVSCKSASSCLILPLLSTALAIIGHICLDSIFFPPWGDGTLCKEKQLKNIYYIASYYEYLFYFCSYVILPQVENVEDRVKDLLIKIQIGEV